MKLLSTILPFLGSILIISLSISAEENRIPFYEDYLKDSNSEGFLKDAKEFLDEKPNAIEAPRLAFDYLMVAKVSREIKAINDAISKLLLNYPQSLPTLHFISSFEKDSKVLKNIFIDKATFGNLASKEFATAYCRALILVARIKGPQFLADTSLRLRAHLLAEKAGVEEIKESSAKGLSIEAKKNNGFANIAKIVLSEQNSIEKLNSLSKFSGKDAEFATAFYLAQLSKDEKQAEDVIAIQLKQALFGKPRNIEKAIQAIALLPPKVGKQADVQTFLGTAQRLDGNSDLAVKTLSKIPTDSKNKVMAEWGKTAQSFANGIQFEENRKKLLLEAIGYAIDQMYSDQDSLFTKLNWKKEDETGNTIQTTAFIGISKKAKKLEIHVKKDKETLFAYRTDDGNSNLYSKDLNQSINFNAPGVFPVPQVNIKRDIETGGFEYNFNLNFSSTQDKMLDEGNQFFESPYMGTAKGREIFLSYLLNEKPIWLSPSQTIKGGTQFPLSLLDPEKPTPTTIVIKTDLSKNLTGLRVGSFSMDSLLFGNTEVLENLPSWPETKKFDAEKFDFPLFMKVLQQISSLNN
jgi:hypothetical protein